MVYHETDEELTKRGKGERVKAWENFLAVQEAELGIDTVDKWLRPLKVVKFDACNLFLEAKDSFHALWFEEHIRSKLTTSFFNNNGRRIKVHLTVAGEGKPAASSKGAKRAYKKDKGDTAATPIPFSLNFDELDPHCTFHHLVVSQANELAYRLLCEVTGYDAVESDFDSSKRVLSAFNPVYLHGRVGTGKTHLLMATACALRRQGLRVIYSRAETFTQHVVSAIRAGEMSLFRQAYRNIDALLIDDVHIFSRKGATQEELFHTFNTLHVAGRQIILTAHCTPQELQFIEPRLVSRFEWGIVVPLEAQGPEELSQILHQKSIALNFPISDKVSKFLLDTFSNAKNLMRAFEALVLRCHLNYVEEGKDAKELVTVAQVKTWLSDLIEEEQKAALTPEKIIQAVADHYGVRVEDVLSKAQSRDCVLPRQVAMHLCRSKLKMPFMKVGDLFRRDHSTVMSSIKQVQKRLDQHDPELSGSVNYILKRFN